MDFDKPVITPEDIALIILSYPLSDIVAIENLGGISNTTYKVTTSSQAVAIRVYSHGQSSLEHIEFELRILNHLETQGFESPRMIRGRNTQILQEWNGYWVSASQFIPGITAEKLELTPKIVGDVGRLVCAFQKAMSSFSSDGSPVGELFTQKGSRVVRSLKRAVNSRNLKVDVDKVVDQWEYSERLFSKAGRTLRSSIIHADLWPPNVICNDGRVVGLIDFDDCCYGPSMIDVALACMEFSMFQGAKFDEELANAFFNNYFHCGGVISEIESKLMVTAMEMACALWLSYEAIEAPAFVEGEAYLHRLELFSDQKYKDSFEESIQDLISDARRSVE